MRELMLRNAYTLKIFILSILCVTAISAQREENILFSTKGKTPTYEKVKYDKYGNRRSISFIKVDENSEHLVEMGGLAIAKIKFDNKSKTFKVKEYDIDKNLLFTNKVKIEKDGYELITFLGKKKNKKAIFKKIKYDLVGNKILEEYLDENKKPNTNKYKIFRTIYKYNQKGKRISVQYFDTNGKPKGDSSGIAKYEYTYDARGNRLTSNFFGEDNKRKENKEGIATESFTYDYSNAEHGNLILQESFDKNEKPHADSKGIAKYLYNYDKKGNKISTEFRDEKGKLKEDGKGFAKYIFEYSDDGQVILEEEYGKDGKLKLDPADGIARSQTQIEKKGDVTIKTTKFFGTDEKLKINEVLEVAIVKTTTTVSTDGKEVKVEYFDTESKPKPTGENYAVMVQKYDSLGNQILEEYFDTNNKPTLCRDGYAKYTATFKDKEMRQEEYFALDGKLIEGDDGFAKQVKSFNSAGKLSSIENFNSENKYIQSNLGYAKMTFAYNTEGNKIEEQYYNEKLEPENNAEGISKITFEYNKECLINSKKEDDCYSLVQYFDKEQKLKSNKKKIAKSQYIYNETGKLKSIQNFQEDNSKHSRRTYSYEFGNKREISWEVYKKDTITRAVYHVYLQNPHSSQNPILRITLNKLYRPISIKLGK